MLGRAFDEKIGGMPGLSPEFVISPFVLVNSDRIHVM